jgi:hypothetical protein
MASESNNNPENQSNQNPLDAGINQNTSDNTNNGNNITGNNDNNPDNAQTNVSQTLNIDQPNTNQPNEDQGNANLDQHANPVNTGAPTNTLTQTTTTANQQGATTFDARPIGGENDLSDWFERFLWFSAGADATILDRCPRSDKVKYQGLGGIVLATGVLASIAMYFAVKTIFFDEKEVAELIENGQGFLAWLVPGIIGLIWGLIIFNLDRFIISSTGKGDGTDRITVSELINGLPRIFMALVIAIAISAPLEIKLFDKEIAKEFKNTNDKIMSQKAIDYAKGAEKDIQAIQNQINIFLDEKKEQDILYAINQEKVQYEITHGGCKDKCNEFKALMQKAEVKSLGLQQEINKLQLRIEDKNRANKERLDEITDAINRPPGLLERIVLLEKLPDGKLPVWIVRLLFIVIEVGPIFFKMMITRGVYDHFKQNMDELRLAENDIFQDIRVQVGPNQVATAEIFYQYGRPFIRQREAQLRVQEQQRVNDEIIRQWQQYLAQQITQHPEQFVANANTVTSNEAVVRTDSPEGGQETQPEGEQETQPEGEQETQPEGEQETQPEGGQETQPEGETKSTNPERIIEVKPPSYIPVSRDIFDLTKIS